MCTIPIMLSNKINPVFVKANSMLLEKYKEEFQKESTVESRVVILEKYWQNEYRSKLIKIGNTMLYIEFKNLKDMTLFLLRWS